MLKLISQNCPSPRKCEVAFTLAEVLITIGIIGIVAALTMPQLLGNFEKKRNATTLKRAYSDLHQYIKAFDYENDCNTNFSNCAPNDGEFVYKFAKFLQDKQNFKDSSKPGKNNWFCLKNPGQDNWSGLATESPITEENPSRQYYLMSPTGNYAYIIIGYPYDNYYRLKDDVFRARILIITDTKIVKPTTSVCNASIANKSLYGKNIFTTSITQFNHILPNGSPICSDDGYYCQPLKDNDCTKESGNYTRCLQKIIQDGWEIKYSY